MARCAAAGPSDALLPEILVVPFETFERALCRGRESAEPARGSSAGSSRRNCGLGGPWVVKQPIRGPRSRRDCNAPGRPIALLALYLVLFIKLHERALSRGKQCAEPARGSSAGSAGG